MQYAWCSETRSAKEKLVNLHYEFVEILFRFELSFSSKSSAKLEFFGNFFLSVTERLLYTA